MGLRKGSEMNLFKFVVGLVVLLVVGVMWAVIHVGAVYDEEREV